MSVLIAGMKMPKCCAECDAEGHYENSYGDEYGFFCPFGYKAYTEETRDAKRLDDCPLVPIPPHGRLGDLDELHKEAVRRSEKAGTHDIWYNCTDRVICALDIKNAPTIIPAEEGE